MTKHTQTPQAERAMSFDAATEVSWLADVLEFVADAIPAISRDCGFEKENSHGACYTLGLVYKRLRELSEEGGAA